MIWDFEYNTKHEVYLKKIRKKRAPECEKYEEANKNMNEFIISKKKCWIKIKT